jgi:hypothetical protein
MESLFTLFFFLIAIFFVENLFFLPVVRRVQPFGMAPAGSGSLYIVKGKRREKNSFHVLLSRSSFDDGCMA